ncbi:alpha/beta fold hydrolase [Streptomyces sp. NPDC059740]|uniref:alpha/beta fold hydrolase n=1 Tax=Streptomyces sp. NPDC059740 TaxID=3346926 RepID=UPI0036466FF1
MNKATAAAATVLALSAATVLSVSGSAPAAAGRRPAPVVQDHFDPLGPQVHALRHAGRTVHYSDTGESGARPVLFIGGTGTTARASGMTEFLRTTRENLGLRLISVERNGFGDTDYDPSLGFADYTGDVEAVLDHLGLGRVTVVAISGGGPYAAHLAAAHPGRIASLHLAAAEPPYGAKPAYCALDDAALSKELAGQIRDPRTWWAFPDDSPVHDIPGFTDRAEEDGARTYYQRGQQADPAPQVHEQRLYCERPGPDATALKAPVYVYTGEKDTTVPPEVQARWNDAFGSRVTVRRYADTGHDVQYRHWDQVLLDMAGWADRTAVCVGDHTRVLPAREAGAAVRHGAVLGGCAWKDAG